MKATTDREWVAQDERIKKLTADNERLSKLLGLVEAYQAAVSKPPKWMSTPSKGRSSALACLQFSDWHLDEVVDPAQVGGLNAYSRSIAESRLKRWASKACQMGQNAGLKWDGALLFLGGDMVSGSIHDELTETNAGSGLPETMVFWAPRIAAAIGQVLDHYKKVHVEAVVGNHGRLTKKMPAKNRGRNSWDWLLYQMVKGYFANDSRVTWNIAEGSYLFTPVYDRHVFLTHGDEANGGSGWAGIWSPLGTIHRRAIELGVAHSIRPAYSVIGHWHQTILAHQRGISCNGSGKGYDEYAASRRFAPEGAAQNFWIEDPHHGTISASALFLTDRRREGW